jgi:predicted acyl esterase
VVYGDRAVADKKLLKYTSPPLMTDLEITGFPVLTLQMASTTSDGTLHAYLEDVAPTGRRFRKLGLIVKLKFLGRLQPRLNGGDTERR